MPVVCCDGEHGCRRIFQTNIEKAMKKHVVVHRGVVNDRKRSHSVPNFNPYFGK